MSSSAPKTSATFYATARDAIVQFARKYAQLPAFKAKRAVRTTPWGFRAATPLPTPILRVLPCGGVEGDALQRAEDMWLTILPFEDFRPTFFRAVPPDETRRDLLGKRVRFLRLLARLANSPLFPLHHGINCAVVNDEEPAMSFWLQLLRALAPDTEQDGEKELERNLATLSRVGKLRILLSVEINLSQDSMMSSLAHLFSFLAQDDDMDEAFANVLNLCGLDASTKPSAPVDVGIEFLAGKISPAMMTTIVDGITSAKASSQLCLSCVRLGLDCPFGPTAAEAFGEQMGAWSLDTLQLNGTRDVRPLSLRQTFTTAATSVRRFITVDRDKSICAIASALRSGPSSIRELELELAGPPNVDLAEWLAYSVFHVDSSAQISSLSLRFPNHSGWLMAEWLVRFKDVLRNVTRPGAEATSTITPDRQFVKLAAKTVVKFEPHNGKKTTLKLNKADTAMEMEVLFEDSGTIAINVPGVGIGRVPAKAVCNRRTELSRVQPVDGAVVPIKQCVTSLTWCGPSTFRPVQTTGHVHMIDELLSVIGKSLTRLSLPRMDLNNEQLSSMLRHVPNLKELNLGAKISCDLTPIMEAHAAGHCNLESLSLHRQRQSMHSDTPIAPQLLRWLTRDRPLRLQRLAINALPPYMPEANGEVFHQTQLLPLLAELKLANGLDYVDLQVTWTDASKLSADVVRPTESYPKLAMRRKLALLSVVHAKQGTPIGRLDASVLGLIFNLSRDKRMFLITNS